MKTLQAVIFLFLSAPSFAQDQDIIKKDFQTIVNLTRVMKLEEVMDMTYPRLFELIPKDQMIGLTKGMMESGEMKMVFEDVPLNLKLSSVEKLAESTICLGQYDQSMTMEFQDKSVADILVNAGAGEMIIEKISDTKVRMKGLQYLLAIRDSYTNRTWKYLTYGNDNKAVAERVLSKEISAKAEELRNKFILKKEQ